MAPGWHYDLPGSPDWPGAARPDFVQDVQVKIQQIFERIIESWTDDDGDIYDVFIKFLRDYFADPIVLDLDGDGIELIPLASSATRFDLDEDGVAERTGWVGPHDALLVYDKDSNEQVDGIRELVGSARVDGFDALKPLDTNNDGRIDAADPAFASLRIWRDLNASGVSDFGELFTPAEAGITSFNLSFTQVDRTVAGNTLARLGSFTRADGTQRDMGSIWFALDQKTGLPEIPEGADMRPLLTLPTLPGGANVPSLHVAMTLDADLRAMVEGIVNGDGNYDTLQEFKTEAFESLIYRWFGVAGPPQLGNEDKPQYLRAIEAIAGFDIATEEFSGANQHRLVELESQWENVVDALAIRFFIQAAEMPTRRAYIEAGYAITALDPDEANFYDQVSSITTELTAALSAASPPPGIGAPFAMLSIDASTSNVTGDFNAFAAEILKDQPSFATQAGNYSSSGSSGGSRTGAITMGHTADEGSTGIDHRHPWTAWYEDQGSLLFDVAAAMGIGPDYVLNVTGWRWLSGGVTDHHGTSGNDLIEQTVTYYSPPGTAFTPSSGPNETRDQRLFGYEGDDELRGNDGIDRLVGGPGNDLLKGGSGSDMYVYAFGDGLDQIIDESGADDAVFFSSELNAADLRAARITGTNNLLLHFGNPAQGITLVNQWSSSAAAVEQFHFVAENGLDAGDIASLYISTLATGGADVIVGSWVGERIAGLEGDDRLSGLDGDDRIDGGAGNDTLVGGNGRDTILAGDGNDMLAGDAGNDLLDGGAGNDLLYGVAGDDVFRFGIGYGLDIIREYDGNSYGGDDLVQLGVGIAPSNISILQSDIGQDLIIKINGTADQLTLDNTIIGAGERVERLQFADGAVWTYAQMLAAATVPTLGDDQFYGGPEGDPLAGGAGNDTLRGRGGDDVLDGGTGNDLLYGTAGDDSYLFGIGYGQDIAREYDGSNYGGNDTILLRNGITPADVTVVQTDNGQDLIIRITGTTDQLTLDNTVIGAGERIEQLNFVDGTVWNYRQMLALATAPTAGNDQFWGGPEADSLSGGDGNDTLRGRGGNDVLDGGAGNDLLFGVAGDDAFLFGIGYGQDIVREYDGSSYGGDDIVLLQSGIAPSDISIVQADNGNDLIIRINGTTDQLTLDNTVIGAGERVEQLRFANGTTWSHAQMLTRATAPTAGNDQFWGGPEADSLSGGDGNDTLRGQGGNDVLDGGAGNDLLFGVAGDDAFLFGIGYGQDIIREYDGSSYGGNDTVLLQSGIAPSDVSIVQGDDGNDLIIRINGTADQLTLDNTSVGGGERVEQLRFADGSVWSHNQMLARATAPTAGNDQFWGGPEADMLSGGAGNDVLRGRGGNDTLAGGSGNDTIYGVAGDDSYLFGIGDGQDIIREYDGSSYGGTDTVQLGSGITSADVTVARADDGRDLVLILNATGDQLTLDNTIVGGGERVEYIRFTDGTVWDHNQLMMLSNPSGKLAAFEPDGWAADMMQVAMFNRLSPDLSLEHQVLL